MSYLFLLVSKSGGYCIFAIRRRVSEIWAECTTDNDDLYRFCIAFFNLWLLFSSVRGERHLLLGRPLVRSYILRNKFRDAFICITFCTFYGIRHLAHPAKMGTGLNRLGKGNCRPCNSRVYRWAYVRAKTL